MLRIGTVLAVAALLPAVPAAWATNPGRNGRIVIAQQAGSKHMHQRIWLSLVGPRSGSARQIDVCQVNGASNALPYCEDSSPAYVSPDGSTAALIVREATGFALRTVSLGTGSTARVGEASTAWPSFGVRWDAATTPWLPSSPVTGTTSADWSPAGRVAFAANGEIYAGPASGPFRQLTFRGGGEPSWSPHGRWIAFSRAGTLFVVPATGGAARRLVAPPKVSSDYLPRSAAPVWSPDGKQIAFYRAARSSGVTQLNLHAINWRTRAVRRVAGPFMSDDPYADSWAGEPDWQAVP